MACPNTDKCELYNQFLIRSIAEIWKIRFCDQGAERHEKCERFKMSAAGRKPVANMLPNGEMLSIAP